MTRRANSALAVGRTGTVDDLVARAEDFYGQRGAPTLMYLAVMATNDAATALYARAGFRTTHDYCYFADQGK